MASSRSGKSKSSGLRILWIPGRKSHHPKGRYDVTNKQVPYGTVQKKNEMWSLGGSKAQKDLIKADSDTTLLDGPSSSGVTLISHTTTSAAACAVGATTAAAAAGTAAECAVEPNTDGTAAAGAATSSTAQPASSPTTPNSNASTALLVSPPTSPFEVVPSPTATPTEGGLNTAGSDMPAIATVNGGMTRPLLLAHTNTTTAGAAGTMTTTTAEVIGSNRFALLDTRNNNNGGATDNALVDIFDFPPPPKDDLTKRDLNSSTSALNTSSGTTASTVTSSDTSATQLSGSASNGSQSVVTANSADDVTLASSITPTKKRLPHRNHNNNQGDVNSIESICDASLEKIPEPNVEWIDDLMLRNQSNELIRHSKNKKKKKTSTSSRPTSKCGKEVLDQLDGVPGLKMVATASQCSADTATMSEKEKHREDDDDEDDDDDDKMVKCLYYTIMCCDCTIS